MSGQEFVRLSENFKRNLNMKKFLVFVLILAGGYFAYEYLIKETQVLEINADKSIQTGYSSDINAPALAPSIYGSVQGTVRNVSSDVVRNIVLNYKLNAEPVVARIDELGPGEVKNFSTNSVMLRHHEVTFFLEEMSFD
jgi:hypothetical protein